MSKTVLITGASRGIGLATARELAARGDDVGHLILVARGGATLAAAREELTAPGRRVTTVAADLGTRAEIETMLAAVTALGENVDILVNNAGYTNPVPLQLVEFDDFERTMMVNVYAPFLITQRLLRAGHTFETVVNVASTAGINGRPGWLTYSASKAALINMSEVMRQELAVHGTRVVCISPGRCATDLRRTLAPDEDPTSIMQPEHVAGVIRSLLSESGRYLDSGNLVVRK